MTRSGGDTARAHLYLGIAVILAEIELESVVNLLLKKSSYCTLPAIVKPGLTPIGGLLVSPTLIHLLTRRVARPGA